MNYKLRGVEYAIANSSDPLLNKVATSLRNQMVDPEDDARVAYAISKACPTIPAEVASYETANKFNLSLDFVEITIFMISLNIILLEKAKAKAATPSDKQVIKSKIAEMNQALLKLGKGLTTEDVNLIVGQIKITDPEIAGNAEEPINVNSVEVDDDEPLTEEQEAIARKYLKQQAESNKQVRSNE